MDRSLFNNRGLLLFEGILFTILGVLAIAVPWVFTLSIEMIVAALFVAGGLVSLYRTFKAQGTSNILLSLLIALLYLIVGGLMFAYPWFAVLSLTVLLAIFFIAQGVTQIFWAFNIRPLEQWGWLLFSGITSVILGIIIWSGLPGTAAWTIGLLAGINMIFFGTALIFLSQSLKKEGGEGQGQ